MTIQQLEYIVALDNYRHYVTAAEHCMVSQPNLTMQIKKLEEEIGVKLFDREQKPLHPTKIGEEFIVKSRHILREVEQLKEMVLEETESLQGSYTIGVIPTVAPYLLPMFLSDFMKSHPDLYFDIKEMNTEQIIQELESGILDVGILATPLERNALREIPVYYEPFLLYLPEGHLFMNEPVVSTDQLELNQLLLLNEGHCFRDQALKICKNKKATNQRGFDYHSGSIEALKAMVRKGEGYTLVPELSITEGKEKNAKRFNSPEPVREISLVVHSGFAKEKLIENIRDVIKSSVPDQFEKGKAYKRIKWR